MEKEWKERGNAAQLVKNLFIMKLNCFKKGSRKEKRGYLFALHWKEKEKEGKGGAKKEEKLRKTSRWQWEIFKKRGYGACLRLEWSCAMNAPRSGV